ncbi:MAG: hypothetical protein ACKV2T_24715 [Kofleriaceae bacterium]
MRTSVRAAQNALDNAIARYREKPDSVSLAAEASTAVAHLEHAYVVWNKQVGTSPDLTEAMNQFSLSLDEFGDLDFGGWHMKRLRGIEQNLRIELGLPHAAEVRTRVTQRGPVADYVKDALVDTFDMITHEARATYSMLLAHGDRNASPDATSVTSQVSVQSRRLVEQCDYAMQLVVGMDKKIGSALRVQADRAAIALVHVSSWLRKRTGTGAAAKTFANVVSRMDAVLLEIGAPTVESHPEPTHSAVENSEAEKEKTDLAAREKLLWNASDTLTNAKLAAIQSFEQLAAMPDNKEPRFVAEVAKALLITTLGNVGGLFIGRFLKQVVPGAADTTGGIANDSMQAVTTKSVDGAMSGTSKTSALTKARVFFTEGLKMDAIEANSAYKTLLTNAIHANSLMAKDVAFTERHLIDMVKPIVDSYRLHVMLLWPTYSARAALGSQESKRGTVTKMDDYFGEEPSRDNLFEGKPDRSGTSGVLSVRFTIVDPDPSSASEPEIREDGSQVNDMNSEIKANVLRDHAHLDQIPLPKEIFVRLKGSSNLVWARLAVDEYGQIRDSTDWSALSTSGPRKFYATPEALWGHVRGRRLSQ